MIAVELSWGEVTVASIAGAMRNVKAMQNGRHNGYGLGSAPGWDEHIDGALCEAALAKMLDRYWDPLWADIDRSRGDVGTVHVRSTRRSGGRLLLHERDPDDAVFVLVVNQVPQFKIVGAITGEDGKKREFWDEGLARPCFAVPKSALAEFPRPTDPPDSRVQISA